MEDHDSASQVSTGSLRSSASQISRAALACARAEAARARASYAEREVQLKLNKVKLEAELESLSLQREAAAADAEADILEAAESNSTHLSVMQRSNAPIHGESAEHTLEYIEGQAKHQVDLQSKDALSNAPHPKDDFPKEKVPSINVTYEPVRGSHMFQNAYSETPSKAYVQLPTPSHYPPATLDDCGRASLKHPSFPNPAARPYTSPNVTSLHPQSHRDSMFDIAKFLARRDLVSTGLSKFNDQPESFRAWRSAFVNATQELELSASEELDLLTKWLGRESAEHVKRIRLMHISNPEAALKKAWDRLYECYTAPELIESSLFTRLDAFPRVATRDYNKLRELGDLLMELQAAKEDGYLPGLDCLDTARGISPVLEKLPHNLQEKWITEGSRFKREHYGRFPPFYYFASFVCNEARTRNDPSFAVLSSSQPTVKAKSFVQHSAAKFPVTVQKTDLEQGNGSAVPTMLRQTDPSKHCPIHKKPHPLKKCKVFRAKMLEERKEFLKDCGICYKCCASCSHIARDCKVPTKCSECNSEHHISAMHLGPLSNELKTTLASEVSEVEEDHSNKIAVSSHCTEVCGERHAPVSCAKICLTRVFLQDQRDKAIRVYAVIDDQSNCSLARSELFEMFNIQSGFSLLTEDMFRAHRHVREESCRIMY